MKAVKKAGPAIDPEKQRLRQAMADELCRNLAREMAEERIRREVEWIRAHRRLRRIEPAGGHASLSLRGMKRLLRRYNRYIAECPEFAALPLEERTAVLSHRDTVEYLLRGCGAIK